MKIIYNNFIPFKGFKCINLFGVLFARKGAYIGEQTLNHERIHTAQMKEMFYVGFYVWYFVEWLIGNPFSKPRKSAYYTIPFEICAYANEDNPNYLNEFKHDNHKRYRLKNRKRIYEEHEKDWKSYIKTL